MCQNQHLHFSERAESLGACPGDSPQSSGGQSYRTLLQQSHPTQPDRSRGWSGSCISLSPLFVCPGFQSPTPNLSKTVALSPGRVLSDVLRDGFPLETTNTHLLQCQQVTETTWDGLKLLDAFTP